MWDPTKDAKGEVWYSGRCSMIWEKTVRLTFIPHFRRLLLFRPKQPNGVKQRRERHNRILSDSRRGKNTQLPLADLFR